MYTVMTEWGGTGAYGPHIRNWGSIVCSRTHFRVASYVLVVLDETSILVRLGLHWSRVLDSRAEKNQAPRNRSYVPLVCWSNFFFLLHLFGQFTRPLCFTSDITCTVISH